MECNKEEASRARRIALKKLANADFFGALRIARQAQRLYPELENVSQLLTACEVYCAADAKINKDLDLYAILQVEATADDMIIRKQYEKLAIGLQSDKSTLPFVETAFKLVSEAHETLCDQMKRSLYDIKRKHASREVSNKVTRLLGKIKSDVTKCTPFYDSTVVFWTMCPHCQKRFVYYQRNFLVSCDHCGKNFFAFKLHEQSMPSKFQSAASNHSRFQAEMFSCQLHGGSNQQAPHTKLHTRDNMDSESMIHAMQTDADIRLDRQSGGDSEVSCSEARSQFPAVIQTLSLSPSGVKSKTGSTTPDSSDPNFVTTQNLTRLGKRKQDGGIGSISEIESCDTKRRRNASRCDDEFCSDNVAITGNPSGNHLPSKVDSEEKGNAALGSIQQTYNIETTDIAGQMYGNPEITYECSDFFDFGKLRDINRMAVDEIWAIYDDHDFMPRVYAQINHVDASNLKVWLSWLDHNTTNRQKTKQICEDELPVAFGNFCLGDKFVLQDPSMYLSHRVSWTKGKNMNSFEIYPKKGEIWALYKESSMLQISVTDKYQSFNYDVVQVSHVSMDTGIIVSPLVRIEGFVSLFARAKDKSRIAIRSSEMHRFSHSIPCYRTNGNEKPGFEEGFLELDTAALPCDLATAFPSIDMNAFKKKRDNGLVVVTYPNSEFHNFDEDRSCEKFGCGQIWALYSDTDLFPKRYGWVSKVEIDPFKVHFTWLKACPEDAEKVWLQNDMPMSCGNYEVSRSTNECCENYAFSHLVETSRTGTDSQVKILPKVGEVWAVYRARSSKNRRAEYAIGEIIKRTESSLSFAFLTKVEGHVSVFKPDVRKAVLEIPVEAKLRFSHRIPLFRLTSENGGKLHGFYELDPASVPDALLQKDVSPNSCF